MDLSRTDFHEGSPTSITRKMEEPGLRLQKYNEQHLERPTCHINIFSCWIPRDTHYNNVPTLKVSEGFEWFPVRKEEQISKVLLSRWWWHALNFGAESKPIDHSAASKKAVFRHSYCQVYIVKRQDFINDVALEIVSPAELGHLSDIDCLGLALRTK